MRRRSRAGKLSRVESREGRAQAGMRTAVSNQQQLNQVVVLGFPGAVGHRGNTPAVLSNFNSS